MTAPAAKTTKNDGPRQRDAARTRKALIAAGTALFAERGYEGVPVAELADKAGVNKAMINYHFGGKRQLYVAIVGGVFTEIVAQVERLAAEDGPAPQLLREVVAVVGDANRRNPHFCTMLLREVVAGGGQQLESDLIQYPARMLGAVQRIVARGVSQGELRPVDPLLTHLSLIGSLVFFFATQPFRDRILAQKRPAERPPDAAAYVTHIQELLTHGLAAER